MKKRGISAEELDSFCQHLRGEERSAATIEKYRRDVAQFAAWLGKNHLEKEAGVRWKAHLLAQGCEPSTVNGKLTALDRFFVLSRPGGLQGQAPENTAPAVSGGWAGADPQGV